MARIKCSLVLSGGTIDHSDISRRLGMVPTLAWKKGDFISPSTRQRIDAGWKFSIEEANSQALEDVLLRLLQFIEPQQAIVRSIVEQCRCNIEFACAIYLDPDSAVPSMHFEGGIVKALCAYNAELDIDLYPNPYEAEVNVSTDSDTT